VPVVAVTAISKAHEHDHNAGHQEGSPTPHRLRAKGQERYGGFAWLDGTRGGWTIFVGCALDRYLRAAAHEPESLGCRERSDRLSEVVVNLQVANRPSLTKTNNPPIASPSSPRTTASLGIGEAMPVVSCSDATARSTVAQPHPQKPTTRAVSTCASRTSRPSKSAKLSSANRALRSSGGSGRGLLAAWRRWARRSLMLVF
jgi:hypothetical protein